MRLEGATLEVTEGAGSLPSEGLTRGAIQLPPGGEPVVFLADHPVTGGYPVIAVLRDADVDRAAQVRPGQPVRIRL
jgi:allophanate hydrolase subunit 2